MLLGLFRSGNAELINAQEIICNSAIRTNYFVTDWPMRALSQTQCPSAGSRELQEESNYDLNGREFPSQFANNQTKTYLSKLIHLNAALSKWTKDGQLEC